MAITGPSSYVPTIEAFLAHWDVVNAELGDAGPLVTASGKTQGDLSDLRDQLQGFAASIQGKVITRQVARGTIDIRKAALVGRLGEFNRKIRGFLQNTAYARALPDVPSITSAEALILKPLDEMASLWDLINAATIPGFSGPLTLLDGYARATFVADLAALRAAYQAFTGAEKREQVERERRNDVQDVAYPIMRDYQDAVKGTFAPEHALVESLPRLTPLPGSTPDAVTAQGQWQAGPSHAEITWTASSDANLDHYEIRMSPGADYDSDSDVVVGNVPPGQTTFTTLEGLTKPGDTATYRVYVILTTDNEAGSNNVTIQRPPS